MNETLGSWIDLDGVVAELAGLVAVESPSHDLAASRQIAEILHQQWAELGAIKLVETEAGVHLQGEIPGQGTLAECRPVLLLGHSDTVWPIGTTASTVPWRNDGHEIAGAGIFDMKAGLVVMRTAIRGLQELGLAHPPVRVVIAADEEVGSASATELVRNAATGAAAVLGFESPHPDGALKVGRLGSTRVALRIAGRESHAALDPDAGVSAIDELIDQLIGLRQSVAAVMGRRPGEVLFNVGAVTGGGRTNVVAGAAEALLGFRFATSAAQAEVMALLDGLRPIRSGATLEVALLSSRPAWAASAADQRLAAQAVRCGATGGRRAAGAADTNTTGAAGVPTLDGFGPRGGGAHAVNEHIEVASLHQRIELLAGLLHHWQDPDLG